MRSAMMRRAAVDSARSFVLCNPIKSSLSSFPVRETVPLLSTVLPASIFHLVRCMSAFRPISRRGWDQELKTLQNTKKSEKSEKSPVFIQTEKKPEKLPQEIFSNKKNILESQNQNKFTVNRRFREDSLKSAEKTAPSRSPVKSIRAGDRNTRSDSRPPNKTQVSGEKIDEGRPRTAWDVVQDMRRKAVADLRSKDLEDPSEEGVASTVDTPLMTEELSAERRKNPEFYDSKGFKTYTHVVPDWDRMTGADVVCLLKKCIIYDENNIVAIDKPYGLAVHGGPSVHHSVAKYLPQLAEQLDKSGNLQTLFMVHRIDKETTGVLLLARTAETAARLNDMFAKRLVKKYYWALTKNVPSPRKGIIDIPIGESSATGLYRQVLRPDKTPASRLIMKKTAVTGSSAQTFFTVLGAKKDCALVECCPSTGVKHQIRVHLAHGLNCPVLGDHKYSHFTKLAPQKLPPSMLKALQVRQSKVRTIPMHLHARALVLPEYKNAQNIRIFAELPPFFRHNMTKLGVKEKVFELE